MSTYFNIYILIQWMDSCIQKEEEYLKNRFYWFFLIHKYGVHWGTFCSVIVVFLLCIGEPFYCNQKLVRGKIRSVEPCYVNRIKLPNVKIVQKEFPPRRNIPLV
jgi:hypothetical protein